MRGYMRTDIGINYSSTSCVSIRHVTHNIITVPINTSYNNTWHSTCRSDYSGCGNCELCTYTVSKL